MPERSYLYVPGDDPAKLAKAFDRGADAIILDLEDSVAPPAKARARELVAGVLNGGRRAYVRINHLDPGVDIAAIVTGTLAGVVVPKATPATLREVDDHLDRAEAAAGLAPGTIRTIPLVETAAGVLAVAETAAVPRVLRIGLGEADLAADLGMRPSPDRAEMLAIRTQVVVASAAAGIVAPIGPVHPTVVVDDLAASTAVLLSLGFRARTAIHPAQLAVVNEVFTPSADEVAAARRTLAVFEAAAAGGSGVGVLPDGRLVDLAVVRSARDVLDRWRGGAR